MQEKMKRKTQLKYWRTGKIWLPIPLWAELERLYGDLGKQKNHLNLRIAFALAAWVVKVANSPAENNRCYEIFSAWLDPRYAAMREAFERCGNQEQAEAAASAVMPMVKVPLVSYGIYRDDLRQIAGELSEYEAEIIVTQLRKNLPRLAHLPAQTEPNKPPRLRLVGADDVGEEPPAA